jgi:hypothetical protein
MSATYEVKAVGDPREWKNDYGVFLAYPVDLTDSEGKVLAGIEWSRKKDSKPPQAGDRVVADIQAGPHGEKLKVDFDATKELGGGGGGPRASGPSKRSGEWKPESQYDPEKVARITRAHSQGMAVQLLANRADFNEAPKAQRQQAVRAWADWFDADIRQAAATALAKSSMGATETPALRPAAADGEIVDEGGIPF